MCRRCSVVAGRKKAEKMTTLVRVPIVLVAAGLAALGSYWWAFVVSGNNFDFALGAAAAGSVVVATIGLGRLTRVVGVVLLGIPVTAAALMTTVYVMGMDHIDSRPRFPVVVSTSHCTHTVTGHGRDGSTSHDCNRYAFTFTDAAGKPISERLGTADAWHSHDVGTRLDVYQQTPGTIRVYPVSMAQPLPQVRTAARVAVPVFVAYTAFAGLLGASRRRASKTDPNAA
jgi:hypothetical protein